MGRPIILISGNDPSQGSGGHSRYIRTQAGLLRQLGYAPHIFCASEESKIVETGYGTIHRVRSPFRPFRHLMVAGHAGRIAAEVVRFLIGSDGPHLIHSFGVWGYVGAKAALRVRARGGKVVHVVTCFDLLLNEARAKLAGVRIEHGFRQVAIHFFEYWWVRILITRFEAYGLRQSDCIVVNYESVRRLVARYAPEDRIHKMPYSSETAFRGEKFDAPTAVPSAIAQLVPAEAPLIVCVSRHSPRKGVDVLLHALGLLRTIGAPFRAVLVGRGPLLEAHRQLLERLNLSDSVAMPGFVPESFEYLRRADIFVLPSLEEGSGSMSLIEALQASVAIVATRIDGIPEDITHEESALLVRPSDAGELSRALQRLLGDDDLRRRLATRGNEVFREKFLPEKWAEALRALYHEFGFN